MTRSACFFLLQLFTSTLGWSPGLLGAYITCTVHMSNYLNSSSTGLLNTMWQAQSNHLLKIITIKRKHFLLSKTDLSYGKSHWVPLVWFVLHSVPHICLRTTFDSFDSPFFFLYNLEFLQLQKWFAHWDPASHFRFWFAISCHIWGYFMPSLLISAVKIQI